MSQEDQIKDAVIDQVQKIYEQAKVELEKVQCPVHGQALKKLEFDRSAGRFQIATCCNLGEKLVEEAIAKL